MHTDGLPRREYRGSTYEREVLDESLIIKCSNCGQKNRLSRRGIFRCGSCKARLSMGGRDDLYLPGTRGQLEELARTLAAGLIAVSNGARNSVSKKLKLAKPESTDFLLLGFHLLDRTMFHIYGETGRSLFTDELLRQIYRNFTSDLSDSEAAQVGPEIISRVNAAQAEFSRYRELFPKNLGEPAFRILHESAKGESDYLILEFVKSFFSPQELWLTEPGPALLLTEAMGYHTAVNSLLRDLLTEEQQSKRY